MAEVKTPLVKLDLPHSPPVYLIHENHTINDVLRAVVEWSGNSTSEIEAFLFLCAQDEALK